jgi:hypothetical protein
LLAARGSTGSNDCFVLVINHTLAFVIFSRERSSTGSNDCFVVVVVVGILVL